MILTFINETISIILAYQIHNNAPAYHIYQPIQYFLISLVFYKLLGENKFYKLYFYISLILFISFWIINLCFLQTLYTFPSNSFLLCAVFLLPQILLLFVRMLNRPENTPLKLQPIFWFSTGNLVFQSTTFLIWGFQNILFENGSRMPIFISISLLAINFFYYGFLLMTLYAEKESQSSDSKYILT